MEERRERANQTRKAALKLSAESAPQTRLRVPRGFGELSLRYGYHSGNMKFGRA